MLSDQVLKPLDGSKTTSAVILLHGLGDSGAGLLDLGAIWQRSMPTTEFLAPDAPFPCDMAPFGYQWFSAQNWTLPVILEGVKTAAPHLDAYLDHVMTTRNLAPNRIALVGFSQGTMMALYVAPRRTPSLAGVLGYSGALVGGETLVKDRQSSPPVLLIHGMMDDVIPFAAMGQARTGLQNANINVDTFARPDLGHSIDDFGLMEGLRFLRKVLP